MRKRGVAYQHSTPGGYAGHLRQKVETYEPWRLVDGLIVGAIVEARSCERFAALAPHLPSNLQRFYEGLLASEARHFQDYLHLARLYAPTAIDSRVQAILAHEAAYIVAPDTCFRFHSGSPA